MQGAFSVGTLRFAHPAPAKRAKTYRNDLAMELLGIQSGLRYICAIN
jgi:hypothetical protein